MAIEGSRHRKGQMGVTRDLYALLESVAIATAPGIAKKFRLLLFIAAALALMVESAHSAVWEFAGKTQESAAVYVDLESIRSEKGLSFTILVKFANPREVSDGVTVRRQILEGVERLETSCSGLVAKYTILSLRSEASEMTYKAGEVSGEYNLSRGSIHTILRDEVCAYLSGGDANQSAILKRPYWTIRWETIGQSKSGHIYSYDPEFETVTGDSVTVRVQSLWVGQGLVDQEASTVLLWLSLNEFSCRRDAYTSLASENYSRLLRRDRNPALSTGVVRDLPLSVDGGDQTIRALRDKVCEATKVKRSQVARSQPGEEHRDVGKPSGSFGTGWYSEAGYVVTAHHVIAGASAIAVVDAKRNIYAARMVASDAVNDLAILDVDFQAVKPAGLPVSKNPAALASRIFTLGFPHPEIMGLKVKFTSGEISSTSGMADDPRILQVSAPVQSGNSGGPIFNARGEVVGVVSAKLSAAQVLSRTGDLPQNVNYGVKSRYLIPLLEELPQKTRTSVRVRAGSIEDVVKQVQDSVFLIIAK